MKLLKIEPESWKEDYQQFVEATEKFYNKELDVKAYKGISGGFGSYAQRGAQSSMLRLRMPGGVMTKEQLKFVADSIRRWKIDKAHFTTCQTLQLHNLNKEAVCTLAEDALSVGIVTRGGGGDFPRNVTCSPLSGVEQGEYFDVLPWAKAASDYLMGLIRGPKLPRKLKVGFTNTRKNITHASYRDLGFVAREDGKFDVYSAGGLGGSPRFGVKVAEAVNPDQILYYVQTMHELFCAHGNYENRAKARSRYMQETLGGPEAYKEAFLARLQEVMDRGDLTVQAEAAVVTKQGEAYDGSNPRVIPQKQEGLYSVFCHPIGGNPSTELFETLYQTIRDMEAVELRISPDESFYVINCTGPEAKRVLEVTAEGAATRFEESVACIGASICQQGVRDSQALLRNLIRMEQEEGFADGVLPQIYISGCPSSCGTHQTGIMGFRGGVKVVDKTPLPAFNLYVKGKAEVGSETMGTDLGPILEEEIPEFMRALGRKVAESGMDFEGWLKENPDGIEETFREFI